VGEGGVLSPVYPGSSLGSRGDQGRTGHPSNVKTATVLGSEH
jgi:hypothetical protein